MLLSLSFSSDVSIPQFQLSASFSANAAIFQSNPSSRYICLASLLLLMLRSCKSVKEMHLTSGSSSNDVLEPVIGIAECCSLEIVIDSKEGRGAGNDEWGFCCKMTPAPHHSNSF